MSSAKCPWRGWRPRTQPQAITLGQLMYRRNPARSRGRIERPGCSCSARRRWPARARLKGAGDRVQSACLGNRPVRGVDLPLVDYTRRRQNPFSAFRCRVPHPPRGAVASPRPVSFSRAASSPAELPEQAVSGSGGWRTARGPSATASSSPPTTSGAGRARRCYSAFE